MSFKRYILKLLNKETVSNIQVVQPPSMLTDPETTKLFYGLAQLRDEYPDVAFQIVNAPHGRSIVVSFRQNSVTLQVPSIRDRAVFKCFMSNIYGSIKLIRSVGRSTRSYI